MTNAPYTKQLDDKINLEANNSLAAFLKLFFNFNKKRTSFIKLFGLGCIELLFSAFSLGFIVYFSIY